MQQTINDVVSVFENFRMAPGNNDLYEAVGKGKLMQKLLPFISSGSPIEFTMLGFPMKSPNARDKVLGPLPDMAEKVAIENFSTFNERLQAVYAPGMRLTLISDGLIFNDVMEVSDAVVFAYQEVVRDMSRYAPINWVNMQDFYSRKNSLSTVREKIMSQFGISSAELEQRILLDPDVNTLYRGMIKFMTGDLAIRDFISNSQLHKEAKKVAREMMFRNEAYSRLVQGEFPDSIRLSMHQSVNNGNKFSFQLIPSPKAWTSPWHAALLDDGSGTYATIHRKDAIEAGYNVVYRDGRQFYFTTN